MLTAAAANALKLAFITDAFSGVPDTRVLGVPTSTP
jgi:hypothetical protein